MNILMRANAGVKAALVFLITIISSSPIIFVSAQQSSINSSAQNQRTAIPEQIITDNKNDILIKILANNLEDRLNKSAAILEITSKLPEVKNVSYANMLNNTLKTLHGIPKDADLAKRNVAQDVLAANKDFRVITFIMPNGDMYLQEPYSRQQNLTGTNFADREYFKGVVSTHGTYLGGVFVSASSGLKQVVIAVPIYSENNEESSPLLGIWIGGFDKSLEESLQSLNITDNEYGSSRIVYVDQYGQKVADSDKNLDSKIESFVNLRCFKNAIKGQSGSNIELINGTKMLVFYEPVKVYSTNWAALLMQPYNVTSVG
jgi:hypothetical protein